MWFWITSCGEWLPTNRAGTQAALTGEVDVMSRSGYLLQNRNWFKMGDEL